MKNNIKIMIAFVLGAIIFGGIGVCATIKATADDIEYSEGVSVKDKIDDLYVIQNEKINSLQSKVTEYETRPDSITIQHCNGGTIVFDELVQKYKKLKIILINGTSAKYSFQLLNNSDVVVYDNITLNQEYLTSTVKKSQITKTDNGWVCAHMQFYN